MKNITIKPTIELTKLSELYDIKQDDLIEKILDFIVEKTSIIDEVCSVNIKISQVAEYDDLYTIQHLFIGIFGHIIGDSVDLFSGLEIWGVGDCPECGCESECMDELFQFDRYSEPEIKYPANFKCTNCDYEFIKTK